MSPALPIYVKTGVKREMNSDTDCGKSMNEPLPSVCNCVFMTVFCYFDFHPLYSTASWYGLFIGLSTAHVTFTPVLKPSAKLSLLFSLTA
jgi:hypothetical protein